MMQITIAERIRKYREQNGMSLEGFGRRLGVSAQAVYKWEQNICYPDITFLPQLAQILECRLEDFFSDQ
ncbi:MAG: helix-turn-helix transcriptional regulator [Clostridia bacterium]|nr:helix-turn-helix transcriptional regulator [Clostridia bacterium]